MSTYSERELQRSSVGIDASGGNTVYRISPPRVAVPFSTTEYVRIDTSRNTLVVTDGETFSEPLIGFGDKLSVFCDSAHNRVTRIRVTPRASWVQSPDANDAARVVARWASNRYDGSTQDWAFTSASTAFGASPAGTSIFLPANSLRDYGYLDMDFTGLLTGDATNAQTLRLGFLRNGTDNTTNAGATQFDGGAAVDSLAISAGITAATACPFYFTCRLLPVAAEASLTPTILVLARLWSTTTAGVQVTGGTSTTLMISSAGTTPFDSTIDNTIQPVFRRTGTAATTVTWDVRSLTSIHHAERHP